MITDNKLKKWMDTPRAERARQYAAMKQQLEFCRSKSVNFQTDRIPVGMKCYHDNLLIECSGMNCEIDSGRMKGHGGIRS